MSSFLKPFRRSFLPRGLVYSPWPQVAAPQWFWHLKPARRSDRRDAPRPHQKPPSQMQQIRRYNAVDPTLSTRSSSFRPGATRGTPCAIPGSHVDKEVGRGYFADLLAHLLLRHAPYLANFSLFETLQIGHFRLRVWDRHSNGSEDVSDCRRSHGRLLEHADSVIVSRCVYHLLQRAEIGFMPMPMATNVSLLPNCRARSSHFPRSFLPILTWCSRQHRLNPKVSRRKETLEPSHTKRLGFASRAFQLNADTEGRDRARAA